MKTKYNINKVLFRFLPVLAIFMYSCSESFLDQPAVGGLGDDQIATQKGAEQLLIGAYAALKGSSGWSGSNSGWVFGSIVGGDAHKGSNAGDQSDINSIASFTPTATNGYFSAKWTANYDGVNRCNATIKLVNKLTEADITEANRTRIIAEARFLRGFYYMELAKMWGQVPYVDETIDFSAGNYKVPNNVSVWPMIVADFDHAYKSLAESGLEKGRANKWAAGAFLGKAYLYSKDFANAKTVLTEVVTKGMTPTGVKYGLNDIFFDNFNGLNDNNKESVFAFQASINDGSGAGNANPDMVLNFPYNGGPGGCCGFFQPSFDLVNSYRVNGSGLPYLDGSYNTDAKKVVDDQNVGATEDFTPDAGLLDARVDWTAGRRGIPYLDWGQYPGASWVRDQSNGGPYAPKKNVYPKALEGTVTDGSSWTKGYTSINWPLMRFADVLLMAAEAEVDAAGGNLETARSYVNMVRSRAANPAGFVVFSADKKKTDWEAFLDKSVARKPAAAYQVGLYTTSFASVSEARKAVHFERKLELAMEGHRFFDLVRWGETTLDNTNGNPVNLQAYLDYEGTRLGIYNGVKFKKGVNEVYPIPQREIDLMNSGAGEDVILQQNSGY
jgi:starch-binding outer membrane protein, SusD/RagB family